MFRSYSYRQQILEISGELLSLQAQLSNRFKKKKKQKKPTIDLWLSGCFPCCPGESYTLPCFLLLSTETTDQNMVEKYFLMR